MVKGISRQVIVVHAPDPQLFEQAIFILKDNAFAKDGVSDDVLLKEAQRLLREQSAAKKTMCHFQGALWAFSGAAITGLAWLLSVFF